MLTVDVYIAALSLIALTLSAVAYARVGPTMLESMGRVYTGLVMATTTLAALIPMVDTLWPNSFVVNVLRGALLATLIVMFGGLATIGIGDREGDKE